MKRIKRWIGIILITALSEIVLMGHGCKSFDPEKDVDAKPQEIVRWYFQLVKARGEVEKAFLNPEEYINITDDPNIVSFREQLIEISKNVFSKVDLHINSVRFQSIDPIRLLNNYTIFWWKRDGTAIKSIRMCFEEAKFPEYTTYKRINIDDNNGTEREAVRAALVLCDISKAIRESQGGRLSKKIWFLLFKSERGWRIFDRGDTKLPP